MSISGHFGEDVDEAPYGTAVDGVAIITADFLFEIVAIPAGEWQYSSRIGVPLGEGAEM